MYKQQTKIFKKIYSYKRLLDYKCFNTNKALTEIKKEMSHTKEA